MPAPDPQNTEQFAEAYEIKQLVDDTSHFRRALNDILVESVKVHQTIMQTLAQSAAANQDLRDKFAAKWLEIGPSEAASITALLQQAIKAAQTTPPPTTG